MLFRFACILLFLIPLPGNGQFQSSPYFGGKVGLLISIGSHQNRIGIQGNLFYSAYFLQVSASSQLSFYANSYGNRTHFWENRTSLAAHLLGGKRNLTPDFQISSFSNQTNFENSVGYAYIWYYDNAQTSQRSGAWIVQHRYFSLFFENDIFGGQGRDRFRTGELQLSYRFQDWKLFADLNLWTGETKNSPWNKTATKNCPSGFRNLSELPYGKTSHGIFAFGAMHAWEWSQISSVKIGMDSEQIRHVFQNKMSHDLVLFPAFIPRKTPHYPRLDEAGNPVFSKHEMRKNKLYFELGNE